MIHLAIPVMLEGARGAGQWKDLQGIRRILARLGTAWTEFPFDGTNADDLADRIGAAADTVIWYYSRWPEAMAEIRRRCPRARQVLRTVNAESLQHWVRAEKSWRSPRGFLRDIYGFLRLLRRDRQCARIVDALAGISPWDDARYWRRLTRAAKVRTVPYVCPWPELLPNVRPRAWADRENTIVCLAGTRDPIGRGHLEGFAALARRPEFSSWRFVASAGLMGGDCVSLPDRVERIGRIEEPWDVLCRIKAVAVLSEWGYGFKTTIADALAAGTHALVHPRQHARLSEEHRRLAIAVDAAADGGLETLAEELRRVPSFIPQQAQQRQADCAGQAWKDILFREGPGA